MAGRPRALPLVRRLLPLLALLAVGLWYFRDAPRDLTLAIDLPAPHEGLAAVRVGLWVAPSQALARRIERFYTPSSPAPAQLRLPIRLAQGSYRAEVTLDYGGRTERFERAFVLERQEQVDLDLRR